MPEQGIAAARNKHRYLLGCKRDNHCVSNLACSQELVLVLGEGFLGEELGMLLSGTRL